MANPEATATDVSSREADLIRDAQRAIDRGDHPGAMRVLTELVREFPQNRSALVTLIDLLLTPWFPPDEQLRAAEQLLEVGAKRFPDEPALPERREALRRKQEQILAVDDGNRRLAEMQDIHRGERCVIIGNGPSLNRMDLSFLNREHCFGLNRIYLGFERFGFRPTYLVAVNKLVIEQSAQELQSVPCTKFVSFEGVPAVRPASDLIVINPRSYRDFFSTDPRQGLCIGSTVTYVAMQLAFWMGFSDVVLIGVDHRFETKGQPHKVVESEGDDPNHFDPNYFGKGFSWQLPDLENSEQMYRIADAYFRAYRNKIVDATVGGACPVFEKADYRELFF